MNKKFFTTALFIGIFSAANAELPEYFKTEVRHVCKHAHSYTAENSSVYLVKDRQGKVLGKVYTDRFDDAQRKFGYAGTIEVAVLTDTEDKVTGVLIGKNQETPRFLDRIRQAKFLEQWNKLHLKDVSGKKVDAVTRATMSCDAIEHSVRQIAADTLKQPLPGNSNDFKQSEIARLQKMQLQLQKMLDRMNAQRKQLKERTNEELEMRFISATQGPDAAVEFAQAKKLIYSVRRPHDQHGRNASNSKSSAHQRQAKQLSAVDKAAQAWKKSPTAANTSALKTAIMQELKQQLDSPASPREKNMQIRLKNITQQLNKLTESAKK
ncbi:MAG: FMN-binding protein [Lentisphaerae bacterium]|nr:FMN-binding protein [Lentisphaerota bacterium]